MKTIRMKPLKKQNDCEFCKALELERSIKVDETANFRVHLEKIGNNTFMSVTFDGYFNDYYGEKTNKDIYIKLQYCPYCGNKYI